MSVLGHCNTFPILSSRWYDRHSHHITCIIYTYLRKPTLPVCILIILLIPGMTIHIPLTAIRGHSVILSMSPIHFQIRSHHIRTDRDVVNTSERPCRCLIRALMLCTSQMRSPLQSHNYLKFKSVINVFYIIAKKSCQMKPFRTVVSCRH